jgi:hypothetical protein
MGYQVTHKRMKRKASAPANAAERAHMAKVAAMGCLVCGQPATVHHVTASIEGGRIPRSHMRVVGLCPPHHQAVHDPSASSPISVENLGHGGFWEKHGIDLLGEAERLWAEFEVKRHG